MNFTHLVGNTPMIRIRYKLDGREGFVWAKLEAYNLSGSIKDRLAAHVITKSDVQAHIAPFVLRSRVSEDGKIQHDQY